MRVISGKARGTKLDTIQSLKTRPTLDRVKEALFNIIQNNIIEANVLDLFAGSGSLGIEALSRGASSCTFCDNSKEAINIVKKNLEKTRLINKATIMQEDYMVALRKLNSKFDIIFIDSPYAEEFGIKSINKIIELNLLADEGIIILETDDEDRQKELSKNKCIQIYDTRKYGRVILMFIRKG